MAVNNPNDRAPSQGHRRGAWLLRLLVTLHIIMLAAYAVPDTWLPAVARHVAQRYARPLFHQQWKLFAPDPPRCSCQVEYRLGDQGWHPLDGRAGHYLERRVAQGVARYTQLGQATGRHGGDDHLLRAMRRMAPPDADAFRLVEQCADDPARPAQRTQRITPLSGP
jgi:hypothetical protein